MSCFVDRLGSEFDKESCQTLPEDGVKRGGGKGASVLTNRSHEDELSAVTVS